MNQNISFLIKKREDAGIQYLNNPKAFIEYSQYMDDVCNPNMILMIIFQTEKETFPFCLMT